jgi:hypothetical protein
VVDDRTQWNKTVTTNKWCGGADFSMFEQVLTPFIGAFSMFDLILKTSNGCTNGFLS